MEEKKNTLLLVDDENANLKVLTHILWADYTIFTAPNGISAIEKAKEYKPDLILLDIIMPEMDGYQALAELKKCEETRKIPIIFITGLSSEKDEEKGLSLDAADYITKPFNSKIVKLRVRNQIQIVNQLNTIERLSMIDQLTNIPNRRSFDERFNMEWKLAIRDKQPISLLILDLDKFKVINDTYGHQQGDIILKTVANIFPASFRRPGDFTARWGGEEFIVLLPNTPLESAMDVAEKIRSDIENTEILSSDGSAIKVTVSIGVETILPEQDSSMQVFISNADKALYAAKKAGRNKVAHVSG
ncbi:MAG: diguanylate cyclase [Treponema sp.]|jgi:diguanylate cyclase (GGDEF)-like protein|nr:diguanylate cyclase [Treponema sp.]